MTLHFCTYFDRHYLPRGLALHRSLRAHRAELRLWVLCMDDPTYDVLRRLAIPEVRPIALSDFERGDAALVAAKADRTPIEYYFTCTASLPLYLFRTRPEIGLVTYVDADLFFFADPAPLFEELGGRSIGIIEHRAAKHLPPLGEYGRFNVGWLSFRRDAEALRCLAWWRERCLEWCHDRVEPGRFAEQKYLDEWPDRFGGVAVLAHRGANVAPWNVADHPIRVDGGRLQVGGGHGEPREAVPLLFYHFHGLKHLGGRLYDPHLAAYRTRPSATLVRHVYLPYIGALSDAAREVAPLLESVHLRGGLRSPLPAPLWKRAARPVRSALRLGAGLLLGRYLRAPRGTGP